MSRKAVGLLVGLVLVGGAVFLLSRGRGGLAGLFGGGSDESTSLAPNEAGLDGTGPGREGATGDTTTAGGRDADDRAASLAGRRIERRGIGSLRASIVRAGSLAPIEGAAVLVTGVGHANEEVRTTTVTDAKGVATFPRLAAGVAYVVRVTSKGNPVAERPDVEIRAGREKDLGSLEVGATAPLTGRVVDGDGKGVAGAEVRILAGFGSMLDLMGNMAELFGTIGREPTPIAKTVAGEDGRFRVEGLPPGALVAVARAPGTRQAVLAFRMTEKGAASGEPTLVLETGAAIGGIVVDGAGAPVAGAQLALIEAGDDSPDAFLMNRTFTTTGPDGRFRVLVDDAAREIRAVVEAAGYPTTFSPALRPGNTEVKLVLRGGAKIEVRVVDDAGKGVEGASATLMIARGEEADPTSEGGILFGSTDAEGTAVLASGPGTIQMLWVSHRDYAVVMASPGRNMGGMGVPAGSEIPSKVEADGVAKVRIRLGRGIRIRGRVLDAGGGPIEGAEVRVMGGFGIGGGGSSRTGPDGVYALTTSSAAGEGRMGQTMVFVRAPGFVQPQDSTAVSTEGAKDGEVVHDVRMLAGGIVRGKVLDEDGSPAAGVEVRLATPTNGFDVAALLGGAGAVTTGPDGAYELRDAAPAELAAAETPPGPATNAFGRDGAGARVSVTAEDRVSASSAPFAIAAGGTVDVPTIRLSKGATLRGIVRSPDGRPAAGARVELRVESSAEDWTIRRLQGRGTSTKKTDPDGRFVARGLAKGKGTVVARASGAAPTRVAFEVGEGDPAELELRLTAAVALEGTVLSTDGSPVEGAIVNVSAARDAGPEAYVDRGFASTGTGGRFVVRDLPRAPLQVSVTKQGFLPKSVPATPGGDSVEIRLAPRTASAAARLAEIDQELQGIYTKFTTTKDDEREALMKRMQELQLEKRALEGDDDK